MARPVGKPKLCETHDNDETFFRNLLYHRPTDLPEWPDYRVDSTKIFHE